MHPNPKGREPRTGALANHVVMAFCLTCIALALPVYAQQNRAADPSDPQATVPSFRYAGSLSRYRPLQQAPAATWQEVNERTNRAGGWRVYAREQLPTADSSAAPAAAAVPRSQPASADKAHQHHVQH